MHQLFQQARDDRGLTNAGLSRILSVSESLICKVMNGKRKPSDDLAAAGFYRVLGLPEPVKPELEKETA